ncbi:N-6 DNA methylase [Pasteurella multocida]|nr:N-6 DNA methylase [Pasteurella multocida]
MVHKIKLCNNDKVLEPSAGEGVFIDEILKSNIHLHIDALDINPEAVRVLNKKYSSYSSIKVRETDTLLDNELDLYDTSELWIKETDTLIDNEIDYFAKTGGYYDKVIGNPPYGAWQDHEKRSTLKKKYLGHYVKETYTLFLLRCLSVLKPKGLLSFIIPDTFMFLNMHSNLRKTLLTNAKIKEVLIFPSKFFPGVNFGYSNLSIITLEKCCKGDYQENEITIIKGLKNINELELLSKGLVDQIPNLNKLKIKQNEILNNPDCRFILTESEDKDMLINSKVKLGDIASVVTGFYTGNNVEFIKVLDKNVKGSKGYKIIKENEIFNSNSLEGIENVNYGYIPYIKRASAGKYFRGKDEWFVRWDKDAIAYYQTNKKSRFQNTTYYFKTGIGIPMVKSKSIKAFLMEDRVFDQSIVGLFPYEESKTLYILALMNSSVMNKYIHLINPTANNSANYIKQLPYIEPTESQMNIINKMVSELITLQKLDKLDKAEKIHDEVDKIISEIYSS